MAAPLELKQFREEVLPKILEENKRKITALKEECFQIYDARTQWVSNIIRVASLIAGICNMMFVGGALGFIFGLGTCFVTDLSLEFIYHEVLIPKFFPSIRIYQLAGLELTIPRFQRFIEDNQYALTPDSICDAYNAFTKK